MTTQEITKLGIAKARQSTCTFRVSAIGFNRKGDLLGTACNTPKGDGKGMGHHAEVNLIKKYGRKMRSMVICRIGGNGNLLPIHPCRTCLSLCTRMEVDIHVIVGKVI